MKSSSGARIVLVIGGLRKHARERRLEVLLTNARCKTLLYLLLLRICNTECLNISLGNIRWNLQKELDENMREQLESSVTNSTFMRLYQRSTWNCFTVECFESIYGRSIVS